MTDSRATAAATDDDATLVPMRLARGRRGAVVAPHHLATAAGLDVLRAGGSAVDAAIATNAVLGVVMPNGCGLGGDAFWLIWSEAAGTTSALNGSGRSAAAIDAATLRARGLVDMPRRGPLPITVPGAVASWAEAHERFGRLSREAVLDAAIELADRGFPVSDDLSGSIERTALAIAAGRGAWADGFHEVYRPAGRPWRSGETLRLPALAATLRRLAERGFEEFYEGETAVALAGALAAAGSPIELDDLRRHASTWGEPIAADYRGVRYLTHPPNSVGAIALQIVSVLGRFVPPDPPAMGPDGWADPAWLHLGIEAAKASYVDRGRIADPDAVDVPLAALLDESRIEGIAAAIDPERADPGPPPTPILVGGTSYLAVVDAKGDAVSLIASNASGFGSGVVDPVTGIHLQNRGQAFSLDPDVAAALGPSRRPVHSLVPGMLLRDGRPWVVLGSMGGDAQTQIAAQLVSALVDGRADIGTAVGAPRWFVGPARSPGPPTRVSLEPRFASGVIDRLASLGHDIEPTAPYDSALGHAHAIELVDGGPALGGSLAAATDPRSEGRPATW